MATFSYTVDRGFERTSKPRVSVIAFGDGYEARVPDGLNTLPRSYRLTFNSRTTTEADLIDNFLKARAAVEAFDWTPADDAVAAKFVCREWTRQHVAAGFWNISATFDEVFES